jgi:hypothetical protein
VLPAVSVDAKVWDTVTLTSETDRFQKVSSTVIKQRCSGCAATLMTFSI